MVLAIFQLVPKMSMHLHSDKQVIPVNGDTSVGWNWDSGAYNAMIGGASALILHFNINAGSCPAVQFRVNYKNGGIFLQVGS
ncbi:hypothetical protein EH63_17880 [Escherichia coli]|nr:hypothetical protein EH63_17880 [Escherichia coli]